MCLLFQASETMGWQPDQMWVQPILAVKLYVLFVLVSVAVALTQLARNWIFLFPRRNVHPESARRAAVMFPRQAVTLQRWMILNILAWAAATVALLMNLFRGVWAARTVRMQVMALGMEQVLQPSGLFFFTMIILYLVRWHILWRAERLGRQQ
jgi:hypothetical protein